MNIEDFINSRMDFIFADLLQNNVEYALTYRRYGHLCEFTDPVVCQRKDIEISGEECDSFIEHAEQRNVLESICQRECYKQGYRDCITLLKMLGALA